MKIMNYIFTNITRTIICIFLITCSYSVLAYDQELSESSKCVSVFGYFESKYKIPKNLLHSISLMETGKRHSDKDMVMVWPWSVNVEGTGHHFSTKNEAVQFVKRQIQNGKQSIDVGCMQINLKHHPDAFINVEEAFDPRANVNYGASFLRSKYEQSADWHKAIAHYHSATESLGQKYHQGVLKIAANIEKHKMPYNTRRHIMSRRIVSHKPIYSVNTRNQLSLIRPEHARRKSNMMVYVPSHIHNKSK
jgi:hypothetical protein